MEKSPQLKLLLEIMAAKSSELNKEALTGPTRLYQPKDQKATSVTYGGVLALVLWVPVTTVKATLMLRGT